jgi:hypothetical protein
MVQVREMGWIDVSLVALQIVAVVVVLVDKAALVRLADEVVGGQQGRLARAQVGEDHPGPLLARIGGLANPLVEGAAGRLAWLLQAAAMNVVQPPVVDAPQPAVLQPAVAEVGAAVGAVETDQGRPASLP